MTDRLDEERHRELDPVEFDVADGERDDRSGLSEVVLGRPGQALQAKAALARKLSRERRARAEEIKAGMQAAKGRLAERRATAVDDALGPRVRLLEEDPDLAGELPESVRAVLANQLYVRVVHVRAGAWTPPAFDATTTFGLLVMDGMIGRRVQIKRAVAVELVGPGDLIRPWAASECSEEVPSGLQWHVFAPARLAVLDERLTAAIANRPELMMAFTDRLLRRVQSIASLMAIGHMTRVEDRLLGTLWHIASGCGRVTPDGVRIPVRLTHRVLAELVGAKRPTVTVALQELRDRGEVIRGPGGDYILAGRPATESD